jgi:sulfur carrier protein ThiS
MNRIRVTGFGRLKKRLKADTTVPAGQTVAQALADLHLDPSDGLPLTAMVNERVVAWDYVLQPGDKLVLVPTIGGGCRDIEK